MTLLREFLGHTRMSRLPVVAVAHWFTMISFGVLFFTLLNAFGQLVKADFALPLIGHFFLYEWVTEFFAWTGLVGIVALMVIRQKNHPRCAAGEGGRRSRFFGSTFWQAYYVELTILGVTICIITPARAGVRAGRQRRHHRHDRGGSRQRPALPADRVARRAVRRASVSHASRTSSSSSRR